MTKRLSVLIAAFSLFTAGCGDPASSSNDAGPLDAAPLDAGRDSDAAASAGVLIRAAEGGLVTSADGLFEIYVSPGALAADTTITITRVADADVPVDVAATAPLSAVYSVEPDGLTFGGDGAWGHFRFAAVPAGLITPGSPETYSAVSLLARPGGGGTVTEHGEPLAYYAEDGTFHAFAQLSHLSLQWTTRTVGAATYRLGVDWPAETHEVGTTFAATAVASTTEALDSLSFTVFARAGGVVSAVERLGGTEWVDGFMPPSAVVPEPDPGFIYASDVPAAGESQVLAPAPTWLCRASGPSRIAVLVSFLPSGGWLHRVVAARPSSCVEPTPVEASVLDTIHGEREGLLVSIGGEPQIEPRVVARPMTTRTLPLPTATGGPSPWFITLSPAAAPPATGPATVTATNSGATMTATRNPTTGMYDAIVDDPTIWQPEASTTFDFSGVVSTVMPPSRPNVMFGPVAGLDTEILLMDPGVDLHLGIRIPGVTRCMGEDVRDVVIFRNVDGSTASVPFRLGLELGAALCGRTVEELTAGEFHVEVGTRTSKLVEVGTVTSRVTVGHSVDVDGRDLLAVCPAGRTYCTSACVDTATDPANCGGCGLMPAEICDGVDNDCDGLIDNGCPHILMIWGSSTRGPTFGTGTGSSSSSLNCAYPRVGTGIYGFESGGIQALGVACGNVSLTSDTSSTPYRYTVTVTGSTEGGVLGSPSPSATRFSYSCPPNTVLTRVAGDVDASLGTVRAYCSALTVYRGPSGAWTIGSMPGVASPTFGSGPGTPFDFEAPTGPSGVPAIINYLTGRYSFAPATPAVNQFSFAYTSPSLVLR